MNITAQINHLKLKSILILCIFFIFFLQNGTSVAQASQKQIVPKRDQEALTLVRQSLARMGSLAGSNRDTVATGFMTSVRTGKTSPLLMKTHGTDDLKNEVGDFIFIRHGNSGRSHYDGKDHKVAFHSIAYQRAQHLPALLILSEIESPTLQCIMLGTEEINGVTTSHIRLSVVPAAGNDFDAQVEDLMSETHVWIDQQGLVVKARTFLFSPEAVQNRSPLDLYYSDYRRVDGFLVPFHVVREIERQKDSEMTFTSIDVNAKLSEADFQ